MGIYEVLKEKGIDIPTTPIPAGTYSLAVVSGNHVYTSGQTPKISGVLVKTGKIGGEVSAEEGYALAQRCTLNALSCAESVLSDLNRVKRVVKATVFINSAPGFTKQAKVADGVTDLLVEIFGAENGKPARSAVGVFELPGNAPCEVELILEIADH